MSASPEDKTVIAARAASAGKATYIGAIRVSQRLPFTDIFLLVSGSTERHVRGLVTAIERAMHDAGIDRVRREGLEGEAHWVLLDYGDVIVHVQQDADREYYALNKLWGDCPTLELPPDVTYEPATQPTSLAQYFEPQWDEE